MKVHPELIGRQIPRKKGKIGKKFWEQRYEDINAFEQHLVRNGTLILKFFLNVSKDEQKARFLERLSRPEKHWKFSASDLAERGYWDDYMEAYEDALAATSTKCGPVVRHPGRQQMGDAGGRRGHHHDVDPGAGSEVPRGDRGDGEAVGRGPQEAGRGSVSGPTRFDPREVRTWGRASMCRVCRPTRR